MIETRGLRAGFWTDLYHRSMTSTADLLRQRRAHLHPSHTVFATFLLLGDRPIANVSEDLRSACSTSRSRRGDGRYGDMHLQTNYGHFVATWKSSPALSFLAVMTA